MYMTNCFVTQIDKKLADQLKLDLQELGFELSYPPYTLFSAKKKGVSCTFYESGKFTCQGKEMQEFIEFYLEPNILKNFEWTHRSDSLEIDPTPRIGVDESGKGDFFGPLCIAGVFCEGDTLKKLMQIGVKDSKKLADPTILKLAKEIRTCCEHHIVTISPKRYNELYENFRNLNRLLAWGHATIIEAMIAKTKCHRVIVDQFGHESLVLSALKRKNIEIPLLQKHRAEEDIVVAAASILARSAFVEGLHSLSKELNMPLPKGGGPQTIVVGRQLLTTFGPEIFRSISKLHFKNYQEIIQF